MYSMEYGRRLSTTFPFNYKAALLFIPFVLLILSFLVVIFEEAFILALGTPMIIVLAMLGTMGDQGNDEAFEYGLKIGIIGRCFRDFVPYKDIGFICRFRFDLDINRLPIHSEGLLLILRKPKSNKLQTYLMKNNRATPIGWILPRIMFKNPNWHQIYHPEVIFLDASNAVKLEIDLGRNKEPLFYLINKYRSF
jgi:hypothetical protein